MGVFIPACNRPGRGVVCIRECNWAGGGCIPAQKRVVRILLECILVKVGTYFGWFERILVCEVNIEEEDAALIDGARRPEDRRHPLVQVVALGSSAGNKTVESVFLNHSI